MYSFGLRGVVFPQLSTFAEYIRELAQKPHEPHAAFGHCAKLQDFCLVPSMFL
jgi:hypothetical protein